MGKRYLVMGHEGRDHALVWKLAQSPLVEKVYVATGNHAMSFDPKVEFVPDWDHEDTADYVEENGIDCTIIGDTSDMQTGVVDVFVRRGLPILGAHEEAAMLEGSKSFAKDFMQRHNVPTARHRMCTDPAQIDAFLQDCRYPIVLKADLRVSSQNSAKIIHDAATAATACREIFDAQSDKFDDEPAQVLLEEFITGRETSYTILTDGKNWVPLIAVRDYKRKYDSDGGCNTGGMGSYAPVPWLTPELHARIADKIINPTLRGMRAEGLQYRGFLYFGIMVDPAGEPWVLEYNTRLGDTEAETILTMWEDDLADVAWKASTGSIENLALNWRKGWAVSVALTPQGWPDGTLERTPIDLPFPEHPRAKVYGSIIRQIEEDAYFTGPGPVACVSAFATDIGTCRQAAYDVARMLDRNGRLHYRRDIALEAEQGAVPASGTARAA